MVTAKQFYAGDLKRRMSRYILASVTQKPEHGEVELPRRADGMDVRDMVLRNPEVFGAGPGPLEPGISPLKPEVFLRNHCRICATCQDGLHSDCYFAVLLPTITHGWKPAYTTAELEPPYDQQGNYSSTEVFKDSVAKELAAWLANGVVRPCEHTELEVIHPIGIALKNSDKTRARALAGMELRSQEDIEAVNKVLLELRLNKVKTRVTTDCTATGLNGAALTPPFSYPSFREAVRILYRGAWIGVSDVGRYFNSFPWAAAERAKMRFEWSGQLYEFLGLCFGFAPCPYFTSTWSAEFRTWALAAFGPDVAHMVDDWFMLGDSRGKVEAKCVGLAGMLEECGFHMAVEKNDYGQVVKYLGVLFDTTTMRMRIDPVQAQGTAMLVASSLEELRAGRRINLAVMRHLAGKLNWFSEFAQSGSFHVISFWEYTALDRRKPVPPRLIYALTRDMRWWIEVMSSWERGANCHREYRILSATELLADPGAIHVALSDASGPDGTGYVWGTLTQSEGLEYFSRPWGPQDDTGSSHVMELTGLWDVISRKGEVMRETVLVWLTDSTGAALSVNKGSCRSRGAQRVLGQILEECDRHQIELVALWIPRESNLVADYLSHLSSILGREEVSGSLEGLHGAEVARRAQAAKGNVAAENTQQRASFGEAQPGLRVPVVAPVVRPGSVAGNPPCASERQLHPLGDESYLRAAELRLAGGSGVAGKDGCQEAPTLGEQPEVRGPRRGQHQGSCYPEGHKEGGEALATGPKGGGAVPPDSHLGARWAISSIRAPNNPTTMPGPPVAGKPGGDSDRPQQDEPRRATGVCDGARQAGAEWLQALEGVDQEASSEATPGRVPIPAGSGHKRNH